MWTHPALAIRRLVHPAAVELVRHVRTDLVPVQARRDVQKVRIVRPGPVRRAVLVPPRLRPVHALPLVLDLLPMELLLPALDGPLRPLRLDVAHPLIALPIEGLELDLPATHVPEVGRSISVPLRLLALVGLLLAAPLAADGPLLVERDVVSQEGHKAEVLGGEKSGEVDEREEDEGPGKASTDATARPGNFSDPNQRGVLMIALELLSVRLKAE